MKLILPPIALCALFTTQLLAAPISPSILNPANNHTYRLLSSATWTASEAEAISLGGHLVTINDQAEQDWVFSIFGGYGGVQRLLWIGLNDVAIEGQFTWTSGEPVTYTKWAPGEPNNANGIEDHVSMYYPNHSASSRWNDWDVRTSDPIGIPFNGVVEIVPEPGSTALIATGAALCMTRRRKRR